MGCMFSHLAAKFAFFPPSPPTYRLHKSPDGVLSAVSSSSSSAFQTTSGDPSSSTSLDVRLVKTKRGNKIVAFYLRNPLARLTLLYSHGNAADLGQLFDLFVQLQLNLRVNLIGYDYSGYGASTGTPGEYNTYADIEAVYECLQTEYGIGQEDLILYGQSVGSGPTLHLAAKLPRLRGVVLHSGILSGLRVLCHVKFSFCCDIYSNINKIKKVKCPVLVIHGTEDDVVNWLHGNRLWKMAKEPYEPLWVKGGGHCNLEIYPDYIRHLYRFIQDMENTNTQTRLKKIRENLRQQERSNECCDIRWCRPKCPRCPKPTCSCKCPCLSLSCLSCCLLPSCISCCPKPSCLSCCRKPSCLSCCPKPSCLNCCRKPSCLSCCRKPSCFSCCPKPGCLSCCPKPSCHGCFPKLNCLSCCSKPSCDCKCSRSCLSPGCFSCFPKLSCFSCCPKPSCHRCFPKLNCLSCCSKPSCNCKCSCSCLSRGCLSCFPNLSCFSCCPKPSCSCRPKCLECTCLKCSGCSCPNCLGCPTLKCFKCPSLKCPKCPSCRPKCPKCPECSNSDCCCGCSGCFRWLCCVGSSRCCRGKSEQSNAKQEG